MTTNPVKIEVLDHGTPARLGVITATTTKTNNNTAVPFNNTGEALERKMLILQPDTACYVKFGSANTVTATAANYDVLLEANQQFQTWVKDGIGYIACLPVIAGTTNLVVSECTV